MLQRHESLKVNFFTFTSSYSSLNISKDSFEIWVILVNSCMLKVTLFESSIETCISGRSLQDGLELFVPCDTHGFGNIKSILYFQLNSFISH